MAEDLDTGRHVKSGLWIYCQTSMNCWYIFSDNLINYYEKVDVCRFLLIGDCRKKLLRTPYFFGRLNTIISTAFVSGWHYAVLIMMCIVLSLGTASMIAIAIAHLMPRYQRITTIVMDCMLGFACEFVYSIHISQYSPLVILLCIALAVFMINAEMLESRFLIGVNNTFPVRDVMKAKVMLCAF